MGPFACFFCKSNKPDQRRRVTPAAPRHDPDSEITVPSSDESQTAKISATANSGVVEMSVLSTSTAPKVPSLKISHTVGSLPKIDDDAKLIGDAPPLQAAPSLKRILKDPAPPRSGSRAKLKKSASVSTGEPRKRVRFDPVDKFQYNPWTTPNRPENADKSADKPRNEDSGEEELHNVNLASAGTASK